jgi:hypothetical protein
VTAETRHKILCTIAAAILLAAAAFHLTHAMAPKADLFWISLIGHEWFQPDTLETNSAVDAGERGRRAVAAWNYPLLAVVSYSLAALPLPLIWSLGVCLALIACTAVALTIWGALREPFFVVALAFFALLGFLPGPVPTDLLFRAGIVENLLNFLAIVGNSGEVFSPLAPWPRNIMLLLFMSACARSWAGRSPWPLIASIALFHVAGGIAAAGMMAAAKLAPNVLGQDRASPAMEAGVIIGIALAGAFVFVLAHFVTPFVMAQGHTNLWEMSAARLIVFAKVTAILYFCYWGYGWVSSRLGVEDTLRVLVVLMAVVFAMTAYGAAGAWWQRSKVIGRVFTAPETSAHYDAVARYYHGVLLKTRAAR